MTPSKIRRNPVYEALASELDARGIPYRVEMGGTHPRLYFTHRGKERFIVFSLTTSDHARAALNAVSELRRFIGRPPARPARSAQNTRNRAAPPPLKAPRITIKPDPWEVLKRHPMYRGSGT